MIPTSKFYSALVKYSEEFLPSDKNGNKIEYTQEYKDIPLQYKKILRASLSEVMNQ